MSLEEVRIEEISVATQVANGRRRRGGRGRIGSRRRRRWFADHLDDAAASAATADVMIGGSLDIIARRTDGFVRSAFDPAASPEGGVAFRQGSDGGSCGGRRRRSVQFHNHRLEFLQIGADVHSAGIAWRGIRIILLLHRLRLDGNW